MATSSPIRVGISVRDPIALCRVRERVRKEGGEAVVLPCADVVHAVASGRIHALVYDMEPGDPSAVGLIRRMHTVRPDCPIWLYYPQRLAVIERVAEVAWLHRVAATAQVCSPLHEAEIRAHVQGLLLSVPGARLLRLLDSTLRFLPDEVRRFLAFRLERIEQGQAQLANTRSTEWISRTELRYLERLCRGATLPRPMCLLDHLRLVSVAFRSVAFNLPIPSAARQAGLSPKAFRRLRGSVLGAEVQWAALEPRAQLEFALMALAKACRAPQQAAQEVVRQVIGEHVA